MYKIINDSMVMRLSDGAFIPVAAGNRDYDEYTAWLDAGNVVEPIDTPPAPTQNELDIARYTKRAAAKDGLIAYMAADNMSRVRSGNWTTQDLIALMSDAEIQALLNDVNTLSFELAAQRITTITNALIAPEIKADWSEKLAEHFYLVP